MPRRKSNEPPKYRHHKARNLAVVTIHGKDRYLGEYGSPESREKYAAAIAELARKHSGHDSTALAATGVVTAAAPLRIADLTLRYNEYAQGYYVKDGQLTHQVNRIKIALRAVNALYAATRADEFGPKKLKAVRERLIGRQDLRFKKGQQSLSRNYVNALIRCIVRMFKWGSAEELVPVSVYQALASVEGLKKGRSNVRETEPVQSVCDDHVNAARKHVVPQVAAMIQLQRLTGMRPCEVRVVRPGDITMRIDGVWLYRPLINKNEHHSQARVVCIGPRAQEILRPWLDRPADSYCFSPREAVETKRQVMRANRQTPVQPSQRNRSKPNPKARPGVRYSRNAYRQAIHRACKIAGVPKWRPNQLRHRWATEVRDRFGLEASQVTLGHRKADVTETYTERDLELAAKVVREVG